MKWERIQKPLREGFQVYRTAWQDNVYVAVEDKETLIFTGQHPEGQPYLPTNSDLSADDWAATGPSGN